MSLYRGRGSTLSGSAESAYLHGDPRREGDGLLLAVSRDQLVLRLPVLQQGGVASGGRQHAMGRWGGLQVTKVRVQSSQKGVKVQKGSKFKMSPRSDINCIVLTFKGQEWQPTGM